VAGSVFIAGLFVLAAKELAADSSRGFFRRDNGLTVETSAKAHSLALIWADIGLVRSRNISTTISSLAWRKEPPLNRATGRACNR